ncbi:MAG: amidohydrolase family protein [Pirellulales bacterium]|nr:amidohydrolase family protein [Pirellulales bacterium]
MLPIPLHHVWQYTDVDRAFWDRHLDGWIPQRIFDIHTHINEPEYRLEPITDQKRRQYWVNEVSEPIGAADTERCQKIVYPNRQVSCLAFGHPSLDYDIDRSNARLGNECIRRAWYHLVVSKPDWSAERLTAELDMPKTLGVKPYYALIPGQDPNTRDKFLEASIFEFLPDHQLAVLNRRHACVMLHVPKAGRLAHPQNIAEIKQIRREYPDIVLIIAHLGRSYTLPHAEQALPEFTGDEGIHFDNSAVLNPEVHRFALQTIGPTRILYGTDNPIFYMRGRRQWQGTSYTNRTNYPFYFNQNREPPEIEATYTLYMYEALLALKQAASKLALTADQIEAIFHGNAERIIASLGRA